MRIMGWPREGLHSARRLLRARWGNPRTGPDDLRIGGIYERDHSCRRESNKALSCH